MSATVSLRLRGSQKPLNRGVLTSFAGAALFLGRVLAQFTQGRGRAPLGGADRRSWFASRSDLAHARDRCSVQTSNGVRGQFVSPENDWQPDDFRPYPVAAYLAEDGGEREMARPSRCLYHLGRMASDWPRSSWSVRRPSNDGAAVPGKLSAWAATVGECGHAVL